ncbi:MAG: hypothetical protein RXO29_03790 [Desulfurococcales archaeon]
MTKKIAVSVKLENPSEEVFNALRDPEVILQLMPTKVSLGKKEKETFQFKMKGFDVDGFFSGRVEEKDLGNREYSVILSAAGETSVGVGVIRYKAKVDFILTFEIVPLGTNATDLRIEMLYTSPHEDEQEKNVILFLNGLASNVEKNLPSIIQKIRGKIKVEATKAEAKAVAPPPVTVEKTIKVEAEQKPEKVEKKEEAKAVFVDKSISEKLGDPLFISELLKSSVSVGLESSAIDEELLKKVAEMSKEHTKFLLLNCRSAGKKLRLLFNKGQLVGAWGEIEGKVSIGEECIQVFRGIEMMCPIYEVEFPTS